MNNPMLQPSRAPGRDAKGAAAPPPPAQAKPAESADGADAGSAPPGAAPDSSPFGGMTMMLPMLLVVFGLFWFMNRNEKKRRQSVEDELKKGDMVQTRAGIICKVVQVQDKRVRVELAPGVNVWMVKAAIEGLADDGKGDDTKDKKDADDSKESAKKKK